MNYRLLIALKDQNQLILLIHDLIQVRFLQRYHCEINSIRFFWEQFFLTDEQTFLIQDKQVRKIIVHNRGSMLSHQNQRD
jgi:hypothetical protein